MTLRLPKLAYAPPPELPDERERLEELYALRILDTASDERFDRYTELLTSIFRSPIALISFVDRDRQWFKSVRGLAVEETPREISFCAHALACGDMLVVEDAKTDTRFAEHPAVIGEPYVRFYAGAVIRGPSGKPIGTCCVIDRAARSLSPQEEDTLKQITRLVEHELSVNVETTNLRKKLQDSALLDSSTGLPNLTLFSERLDSILATARTREESFMLALLRVDRFDTLEAAVGREPASYLIRKLVERIEDSQIEAALVGQVREDKLGLCLPLDGEAAPEGLLEQLLACVEEPLVLDQHTVQLRVSVGACVFPRDAASVKSLLKRARTALWAKPTTEQSHYRIYRRGHSNAAMRTFKLESALKNGLEQNEFHLVYQPKINLQTRRVVGAEALLRWTSRELGIVPPSKFIPVAEESGLIGSIGDWVLSAACEQLAAWRANRARCPEIAVNITSSQLRDPDFPDKVRSLLEIHGLTPEWLSLELTESSLVDDIEGAVKIMRQLRKLGVTISIDDFGTGFSSLSYLRRMPVRALKIDRSFVAKIPGDKDDLKLVSSIVAMAHGLGLLVVAEGIENNRQLACLRACECDEGQGFLISRPLAAAQLEDFVVRSGLEGDYQLGGNR